MNYEQMWEVVKGPMVQDLFSAMKQQVSEGKRDTLFISCPISQWQNNRYLY